MGPPPKISTQKFIEGLVKEAPYIEGDDVKEARKSSEIEWLDVGLLEEGREFVRRNSFSIMVYQLMGMMFGFSFPPFTSVIIRNGKFEPGKSTFTRSVASVAHIVNWYESDILTPDGKGFKDIQFIRKLHAFGVKRSSRIPLRLFEESEKDAGLKAALKSDLNEFIDENQVPKHLFTYTPLVLMSQLDMTLVQFVLFAPICLFPGTFGINKRNISGKEGFIHMWALIGRLMGIQDRFNIALHGTEDLFASLFNNIVMAFVKDSDSTALALQKTLVDTVSVSLFGAGTHKSIIYVGLSVTQQIHPNYTGANVLKTFDWKDWINLIILKVAFFLVYHFDFARRGINKLMRMSISSYAKTLAGQRNN